MAPASILVVDDEEDIRSSVQDCLEGTLDVRCLMAEDGDAALRLLEEADVQLVITDYRMPGMDGLELIKAVAKAHPGIPMILVTAFPDKQLAAEAELHGASFMAKPLDVDALIAVVGDVTAGADAS